MRRYELSKDQYYLIEDLLPFNGKVGGQWKDHHSLLNGMFWVMYSGAQWREMPERYRPYPRIPSRNNLNQLTSRSPFVSANFIGVIPPSEV